MLSAIGAGILAMVALIGLGTVAWSAMGSGSSVIYTSQDVVTLPAGTTFNAQTLTAAGPVSLLSTFALTGDISPTQITADQDNYNPTGLSTASVLRLTSDAARNITGLAGGADGRTIEIYNVGSFNIVLVDGPTASTDANEFALLGNLTLAPDARVTLRYDATSSRWRAAGIMPTMAIIRTNQALAAGTTIQHAGRLDVVEIVQISSTGGSLTNTASTRILAGQPNQMIILQGTSATDTYTVPDGNGVKWATASSVLFDDRASRLLVYNTALGTWREGVTGAGGGGGGGTAASISYSSTGTVSATNVQTAISEVALEAEQVTSKSTATTATANGYIGADASGNVPANRASTFTQHADLSNASQITVPPATRLLGMQCSSGACDLTTNPQIVAGTAAQAMQTVQFLGTHATQTVKLDNGTGVRLCGNVTPSSVIIGLADAMPEFRWNPVLSVWEQINCTSAQEAVNTNPSVAMYTCGDVKNQVWDGGGGMKWEACLDGSGNPVWKAYCSGSDCQFSTITNPQWATSGSQPTCNATARFAKWPTAGGTGVADSEFSCLKTTADTYAWANTTTNVTKTACMTKESVTAADNNRLFGSLDSAITVVSVWAHYEGAAPTTAAQFQLVGMTHTPPTPAGPTAAATAQSVTGGNTVAARVPVRWSVTNTPNPATDTYSLCMGYIVN